MGNKNHIVDDFLKAKLAKLKKVIKMKRTPV